MITKVHQSKNLGGTMRYVYQEYKGAEVVDSTCMRNDLEGAYAEISQTMEQRPEIKKPVFHAILSVPAGDEVTSEQWQQIATEYTERMGFGASPYVAVAHHDTDHHHIHIVASRVDVTGKLVSDSFEKYRSQEIARDLEIKHGLTRVPSSWEVPERAPTREEYHGLERTGQESTREHLKAVIKQELERHEKAPELAAALARHDIKLVPKVTQDERKVVGVYFEHEGRRIPGSKVSREYSWPKLSKRLEYNHERDYARLVRPPEQDDPKREAQRETSRENKSQEVTPRRDEPQKRQVIRRQQRPSAAPTQPTPTPHRSPRRIERTRPSEPPAGLARREGERPLIVRSPEVSTTPKTPPVEREVAREEAPKTSPTQLSQEQVRAHMKQALERADYARGWERWAESLKAQGVEPVPKGTQADPTKVRGMYFESGGHTLPGSQVARAYSIQGLEGRLGAYEPARDARAFSQVEVPGQGRQPMPSTPTPDSRPPLSPEPSNPPKGHAAFGQQPPQDTVRPLVERLRSSGVEIKVEPERFEGQWRGTYQDAQGGTWGALSKDNTVALVKLEDGERVIEATRGERGQVVPSQVLPSHASLASMDHVEWRKEGENKALLKVEPMPTLKRPLEQPAPIQKTPARMQELAPLVENQPKESPVPERETKPKETLDVSAEEWVRMRRELGERARVLEVGQTVRGHLQSEKLELRDGSYHVVQSVGGSSVLIKERRELEELRRQDATPKVSVRIRRDQSLAVSELKREQDRRR